MKYLFYDLEYATFKDHKIKICEFGYVLTDKNFNLISRNNFIINPNIDRGDWNKTVVDEILNREISEYENKPLFSDYYLKIKKLIEDADFIIGHSLVGDAKAINDECIRYELESINYDFYDIKDIYKKYSNNDHFSSVQHILEELDIDGETNFHDAGVDAYDTMLELKEILNLSKLQFNQLLQMTPEAKDSTYDFKISSIENKKLKKVLNNKFNLLTDGTNLIKKTGINKRRYEQFTYNVLPNNKGSNKLLGKKIYFSINYEKNHYKQMLNLVQMIKNEGGRVIKESVYANIYIKYDIYTINGNLKKDTRLFHVKKANLIGKDIKIISIDLLLNYLNITKDELDKLPMVSLDCLFDESGKLKKNLIQKKKHNHYNRNNLNKRANLNAVNNI